MLRLLYLSMNALQVLWKWNTFTEKVILAHNGSIREACGAGKWTNLDHFCHSEQSSDNQRLIFLWSISTLEIFFLKMYWFSHFLFTHMSLKMCLFVCVPIGIFQSTAMPKIAHRHTHIWETHQSLLQRGSSREYMCIEMDVWYMCIVTSILNNFLSTLLKQDAVLHACMAEANSCWFLVQSNGSIRLLL